MDNPWLHLGIGYQDGSEEWGFQMDFNLSSSPNMDPAGIIYACDSRYLYALKPAAMAPPAKSSWPMWRANHSITDEFKKRTEKETGSTGEFLLPGNIFRRLSPPVSIFKNRANETRWEELAGEHN